MLFFVYFLPVDQNLLPLLLFYLVYLFYICILYLIIQFICICAMLTVCEREKEIIK